MRITKEVVISEEVIEFISDLSYQLLQNEYFGFYEAASKYVDEIYDQIFSNIHIARHHTVPAKLKSFGDHYFIIKSGRKTAWHIYFIEKNDTYFVTKVLNNHLPFAKFLNQ